ncbi:MULTISPECIES: fluoride efflux transporter CrcB [Alphaproteobacteria]|uniref:Fluoride-specific ion channel FluC n=2 Tax=Alphaproteobacteria TaxID=28211 RepID=A0A512HHX3_9HYPH|nr:MULTISPECIES: fluoride efflux transporter CrcB [Alphaproteobacteria]GEO84990.1 putative fluoride ion transporter CrcB [Ciceribacter naphthalenivorans]GLR22924.1 putative fluoride ion transporter CrcB [Ciceribacter naphthalenivorans]GLT05780.1 putative fluoride ion transporter CrcB [Sphingomonas psychrolutea]
MNQILLVAIGGALGSVCRYLVGLGALRLMGASFPWGTLTVNVAGSFAIGFLAELVVARFGASAELRLLLITGFLGGFTTFSAFALDAVTLLERGATLAATTYVLLSIGASIVAVIAGIGLMRSLL